MTTNRYPLVRLRVDVSASGSVGPGKIALLEGIATCGSLSKAARELGISYRRAWLLLADLNRTFDGPVTISSTGGRRGGGAELTALGRDLVTTYRRIERAATREAARRLESFRPQTVNRSVARSPLRRSLSQRAGKLTTAGRPAGGRD
jgi:molybdate transport system regulatory protein